MSETLFIHGIMQRCGTHFLHDLLLLHPDCAGGRISEDHLLTTAPLLTRFLHAAGESWEQVWLSQPRDRVAGLLRDALSAALLEFCRGDAQHNRYVVCKTPSTLNLRDFFQLFPSARVILLVRDGRDVIESGTRTFGWDWEVAVRRWRESADRICAFVEENRSREKVLLLRYEDVFMRTEHEMRRVLAFLELDQARYDFPSAVSLPVRGSCEFGRTTGGAVHWDPVARSGAFKPVDRHSRWPQWQLRRFAWLAGNASERLGYTIETGFGSGVLRRLPQWARDLAWNYSLRAYEMRFLLRRAVVASEPDFTTGQSNYYEQRTGWRLPLRDLSPRNL
jgi:hypothetical protein